MLAVVFLGRMPRVAFAERSLLRNSIDALLDLPGVGRETQIGNAQEPFRSRFRSLQGVELLPVLFRENTLYRPARGAQPIPTQDSRSYFARQVEEVPIRSFELSGDLRAIEILDDSPPRHEGITFDRHVRRQSCAFPDEDGPASVC